MNMNVLLILLVVVAATVVMMRIRAGLKRQRHVFNILHAKHSYPHLYDEDKNGVDIVAIDILHRDGVADAKGRWDSLTEFQKYSLRALAMAELEIQPLDHRYSWSYNEHPLAVPAGIETDEELFGREHKIDPEFKYTKRACIYWANEKSWNIRRFLP